MSHLEFLKECDSLLNWIVIKGRNTKITQDQLEEFTRTFKNSTADLTTHLFKSGHIESFYGNRIAPTKQGIEFAKSSGYEKEFSINNKSLNQKSPFLGLELLCFFSEFISW